MRYYFISDLHLSKENPETLSDFKNFSQNCIKPNSQVYILGDLIEVWIGDDHEDNFYDEVKKIYLPFQKMEMNYSFVMEIEIFLLEKNF